MRKLLIYIGFILACLAVAATFATAGTYAQLVGAVLLYPVLVFIALKLFPHGKPKTVPSSCPLVSAQPLVGDAVEETNVDDHSKREFLNLIGTAGITFFLYSIFDKRAESIFLGKAMNSGITAIEDAVGNIINPAMVQPTDGYQISDIDTDDMVYTYFGYTRVDGGWFITRQDESTGTFRYVRGSGDYQANWDVRGDLNYDYFHNIFSK